MMSDKQTHAIQLDGPYFDILKFRQMGLCCSQIVVKLVLRDRGQDIPDLVRAMAALCYGSCSGGLCGVFTGAACALSLTLKNSTDKDLPDAMFPLLLGELADWFNAHAEKSYGGSRCNDILTASPDKQACSHLLISTVEKLQSMLATTGSTLQGYGHE